MYYISTDMIQWLLRNQILPIFIEIHWILQIWELTRENRKEEIHIYYIYLISSIFLGLESTGWQNRCSSGLGKFPKVMKCSFKGKMDHILYSVHLNMIYMIPEERLEVVWTDIHIILLSKVISKDSTPPDPLQLMIMVFNPFSNDQ